MKTKAAVLALSILASSQPAHAEGWFDSIKKMLGFEATQTSEQAAQAEAAKPLDMAGMIAAVAQGLGTSTEQTQGGLASLLNYAKSNLSSEQFSQLGSALPGVDSVLKSLPQISSESGEGLSGLLDKASEYSESLKAVNDVKKQFEALGLNPDMIAAFVQQANAYLDSEQGQEAKKLLSQGLSNLIG